MQESQQSQPGNPSNVSDLIDNWGRVCDTCGDVGVEDEITPCCKCTDGAQHIYCMRVKLEKVPKDDWICEECMLRAGTNKLMQYRVEEAARKKGRLHYSKGSKLKSKSSYARKSEENGFCSTSKLSAKRHGVPLAAQSEKKARATETSAVSSKSSKPCNNSLHWKEKVPHACGDRERVSTSVELGKKGRALQTSITSHKASHSSNHHPLGKEPPSEKLGKVKLKTAGSVTSLKQSSYSAEKKAKLPYYIGSQSPRLGSQTDIAHHKCSVLKSCSSEVASLKPKEQLTEANSLQKHEVGRNPGFHDDTKRKDPRMVSKSMSYGSVNPEKSNTNCSEVLQPDAYELRNPAMCMLASYSDVTSGKSEKESIPCREILFSGSQNTHKGSNCANEKKKNESQQAEHPTKAATAMSIYKLCTGSAFDESSHLRHSAQIEAAALSQGLVIPEFHYTWLGKFQIHNSKGIARTCDGIQAHLSTYASPKVLDVVDRLPEIIILEELPRMTMWPSQFMGRQVTEENIGLYFFAKDVDSYATYYRGLMNYMTKNDLALKGNLDGVELFIFPSNILPKEKQCWNHMLFFWGVFRAREVNNSANTPVSNSIKQEYKDIVKIRAFDLNAYPQDEDEEAGIDEIPQFENTGSTGDKILLVGDSSDGKGGEAKPECAVIDVNLPPPENDAVEMEDNVKDPSMSLSCTTFNCNPS